MAEEEIIRKLNSMHLNSTEPSGSKSNFSNDQISDIIKIVSQTIAIQNSDFNSEPEVQEQIDFSNIKTAEQSEKIPDAVKCLREFSGKPDEFSSWRKSVDRLLEMYQSFKNTPKYHAILHMIRHKIVGDADVALESYRTPLNWGSIKKCLMMHYSDKRDISTLEYQMTVMTQGPDTINTFYQRVYQHLSLILNKIDCLEFGEDTLHTLANTYREKALDTFIRGLNGDLPRLLSMREPSSLPQALHLCLKLDNMTYRLQHAHASKNHYVPRIPPKPQYNGQNQYYNRNRNYRQNFNNRQFYPELTYLDRTPQFNNNQNPNFIRYNTPWSAQNINNPIQNKPFLPPKPQPRPEPMDVDRSLNSVQVNYQNRPQNRQFERTNFSPQNRQTNNQFFRSNNAFKRPGSDQYPIPKKIQRNYHTYSENPATYIENNNSVNDIEQENYNNFTQQRTDPYDLFPHDTSIPTEIENDNFLELRALPYYT